MIVLVILNSSHLLILIRTVVIHLTSHITIRHPATVRHRWQVAFVACEWRGICERVATE